MKELQKLKKKLKAKISEAESLAQQCKGFNILDDARYWRGRQRAYEIILYEVELLLKKPRKQATDSPIS